MFNILLFSFGIMNALFLTIFDKLEIIVKWLFIIINIILIILSIASFIYTKIKSKKIKEALEANDRERANELQEARNPFEELLHIIETSLPNIIQVAENSANNGIAKKFIAMSQIMLKCNEAGVDYKEHEQELSKLVDDFVAMSKHVNTFLKEAADVKDVACECEPLTAEEVEGVING